MCSIAHVSVPKLICLKLTVQDAMLRTFCYFTLLLHSPKNNLSVLLQRIYSIKHNCDRKQKTEWPQNDKEPQKKSIGM